MRLFKSAAVIASVIGFLVALSACDRHRHEPMKLGSADITAEQSIAG